MTQFNKLILSALLCSSTLMADGAKNNQDALSSLIGNMMENDNKLSYTINLAGKQRMLTQRMSKVALLVSLEIDSKKYLEKLDGFSKLYDQTLSGLKKGDAELNLDATEDASVLKQIEEVEKLWKPFYENVQKVVKDGAKAKDAIAYIIEQNEALLKSSDMLVTAFDKSNRSMDYLTKFRLQVVNLAGRERMLIQKMTKEKLLVCKLKKGDYKKRLKESIELFDSSLVTLIDGNKEKGISKPTDSALKEQYAKVKEHWSKLKPLYIKEKLGDKKLKVIIDENSLLLKEMNEAVNLAETVLEY
jgi:hypothetical protein